MNNWTVETVDFLLSISEYFGSDYKCSFRSTWVYGIVYLEYRNDGNKIKYRLDDFIKKLKLTKNVETMMASKLWRLVNDYRNS